MDDFIIADADADADADVVAPLLRLNPITPIASSTQILELDKRLGNICAYSSFNASLFTYA